MIPVVYREPLGDPRTGREGWLIGLDVLTLDDAAGAKLGRQVKASAMFLRTGGAAIDLKTM
jgi:hypothetical protein